MRWRPRRRSPPDCPAAGRLARPRGKLWAVTRERVPRALRRRPADEDAGLVARAQAGEREAFEELVRRHAEHLYAVVVRLVPDRHDAEEVTQEAFIRAWRAIGRFKGDARFFTWLYRIAINEARRHAQRR